MNSTTLFTTKHIFRTSSIESRVNSALTPACPYLHRKWKQVRRERLLIKQRKTTREKLRHLYSFSLTPILSYPLSPLPFSSRSTNKSICFLLIPLNFIYLRTCVRRHACPPRPVVSGSDRCSSKGGGLPHPSARAPVSLGCPLLHLLRSLRLRFQRCPSA